MPATPPTRDAAEQAHWAEAPLPWLAEPLRTALTTQHTHALLLHGPQGVGQFEMALTLAQAWLCEADHATLALDRRPCGVCASCHLVRARSHPDLMVLLPEALSSALGWTADEAGEEGGEGTGKRKPSKDIRVNEVRRILAFAHTTAARERGKVVVLYPAEAMNAVAANALLKVLEEPPGALRFVLAGTAADALLPTIRSRCQSLRLGLPDTGVATAWLQAQGVPRAEVLLAATGGQPQEALSWYRDGIDVATWLALPAQLARGDLGNLPAWPLARVIDMMSKLCHDTLRMAAGAAPRFFPADTLRLPADEAALRQWHSELQRVARHAEHPWQANLTIEALVQQARGALAA